MLSVAQRSETIAREMTDPIGTAAAQAMVGVSHHLIGNHVEARAHLEAALAQAPASNSAKGALLIFTTNGRASYGADFVDSGLSGPGGSIRP